MNVHEEHLHVRALLQKLNSTYVYQEVILPDRWTHQSIVISPTPRAPRSPQVRPELSPANRPSALAFALAGQSWPQTPALLPAPVPTPAAASSALTPAQILAASLQSRGYELLTRHGKLFVKHGTSIPDVSEEDRVAIQAVKPKLIALATPWPEEKLTSLAVFLGNAPITNKQSDWIAQEPPDISHIHDIIVNFETTGFDVHKDEPIGVTIGSLDGQLHRYLPFAHRGGGNLDRDTVIRYLQHEVQGKRITNANTRFEVHMGLKIGVDFEAQGCEVSDVMHWAALIDDHRKRFALDILAQDYLGGVKIGRVDESMMADYHASSVAERAEYQATLISQLHEKMWPILDEQNLQQVRQLEDDAIYAVVEMERNGSLLDVPLLEKYHKDCIAHHDRLMLEIAQEAGFAFEHTASGWQRLLEHLNLSVPDSFAETVLNQYDHPTIRKAQKASQYASLDSKTFSPYLRQIDSKGVFRYDINQLRGDDGGTVSGRFSIGYVHQVPNRDNHFAAFGEDLNPRRLFIPAVGDYFEGDAEQIEFRLLAHFAKNQEILDAYANDPHMSWHKMTWAMMKKYKKDLEYSHMKNFNFAWQYGAKLVKLALMMGMITEQEARQIREAKAWNDPRLNTIREIESTYRKVIPESPALLDQAAHLMKPECDEFCRRGDRLHQQFPHRGFIKTICGRRSRSPNGWKSYIGLNRVLQGSGADILKKKVAILHRERKHTRLLMRMTVHDSVCGDAQTPETLSRVREILDDQSFPLRVKILWACGTGPNWAEAKS